MEVPRRKAIGLLGGALLAPSLGSRVHADTGSGNGLGRGNRAQDITDFIERWSITYSDHRNVQEVTRWRDGYLAAGRTIDIEERDGRDEWIYSAVLSAYDSDGTTRWEHTVRADEGYEHDFDAAFPTEDGVVAVGGRWPRGDGEQEIKIVWLDEHGSVQDRRYYRQHDNEMVAGVTKLADGGIAILGQPSSAPDGGIHGAQVRIVDPDGSVRERVEFLLDSIADPDGIVRHGDGILTLLSYGPIDPENHTVPPRKGLLVKFDAKGNEVWRREIDRDTEHNFSNLVSVTDGFLAVGDVDKEEIRTSDGLVVAVEPDGSERWRRRITGIQRETYHEAVELDDSYVVAGWADPDTDESGNHRFGGDDNFGVVLLLDKEDGSTRDRVELRDGPYYLGALEADGDGGFLLSQMYTDPSKGTELRNLVRNEPPTARISVSDGPYKVDEEVTFSGSNSTDVVGVRKHEWDLDGDGDYDESGSTVRTSFNEPGEHEIGLRVEDSEGIVNETTRTVTIQEPNEEDSGLPGFGIAVGAAGILGGAALRARLKREK